MGQIFGIKTNFICFILLHYFSDHFLVPIFFSEHWRIPWTSEFSERCFALEGYSWSVVTYTSCFTYATGVQKSR